MRVLSLFSGVGAFDLGLERAGMTIAGQVEIDPFCRRVLAKHWPDVPRHDDVRTLDCGPWTGRIDVVAGGVPCQPASFAGKRKGAGDERWLWGEFVRVVRGVRPRWFVAENVRGFLSLPDSRGVVRDLEGAGYALWPLLLGAHHVGAPHRRDRVWIVGRLEQSVRGRLEGRAVSPGSRDQGARAAGAVEPGTLADPQLARRRTGGAGHADECGAAVADARRQRLEGAGPCNQGAQSPTEAQPRSVVDAGQRAGRRPAPPDADQGGTRWPARPGEPQHDWEEPRLAYASGPRRRRTGVADSEEAASGGPLSRAVGSDAYAGIAGLAEPAVGGATHGTARGLARWRRCSLKALGNAVVPQVAEVVGRAIMEVEGHGGGKE